MTQSTLQRCASSSSSSSSGCKPTVTPRADIWETADAAHLTVELPGVTQDGLDLQVENDRLTLSAQPAEGAPDGRALGVEWRTTAFQRTFLLTDDADRDAIEANLRHGLLTIRIPRRAEKRPRSIPVRISTD
jgi:HSP20 family molecular chaperone IbpA